MRERLRDHRAPVVIALLSLSLIVVLLIISGNRSPIGNELNSEPHQDNEGVIVKLPEPRYDSGVSLEQSLLQRRSVRNYTDDHLTLQEVAQLLWAAQGTSDPRGLRTSPSAGAKYPLKAYVVVGNAEDLVPGVYRYDPDEHRLTMTLEGDKRAELADAALSQHFIAEGAVAIVLTAVYERTTLTYGDRGVRYVHMEAGHAAQNVYLQATAMDQGTVAVGAFYDEQVASLLGMPDQEQPLYILPVGRMP